MKEMILHPEYAKNNVNFNYDHDGPKIAFCLPPDKQNRIRVVNYFDTCRETITGFLRAQLHKAPKVKKNTIDTSRVRLLFYFKINERYKPITVTRRTKLYDNNMLKALKIVNHLEKKYKWGRTNLQKISCKDQIKNRQGEDISDNIHLYMLVGSSKWLKSPQMLSLYMLLLRIPSWGLKAEFKTHREFIKELEDFSSSKGSSYNKKKDQSYVVQVYDKLDLLFANYNKLFGRRTLKSFYDKNNYTLGDSGAREGVYKLCIGKSVDRDLDRRFQILCKENKIEINVKKGRFF